MGDGPRYAACSANAGFGSGGGRFGMKAGFIETAIRPRFLNGRVRLQKIGGASKGQVLRSHARSAVADPVNATRASSAGVPLPPATALDGAPIAGTLSPVWHEHKSHSSQRVPVCGFCDRLHPSVGYAQHFIEAADLVLGDERRPHVKADRPS